MMGQMIFNKTMSNASVQQNVSLDLSDMTSGWYPNEMNKELTQAISELATTKQRIEEYEKPILVVEDKYDEIYKIAYLKVHRVAVTSDTLEDLFSMHALFTICSGTLNLATLLEVILSSRCNQVTV